MRQDEISMQDMIEVVKIWREGECWVDLVGQAGLLEFGSRRRRHRNTHLHSGPAHTYLPYLSNRQTPTPEMQHTLTRPSGARPCSWLPGSDVS